jgi:hypothetical protein
MSLGRERGHMLCPFLWARANGCPRDFETCDNAAGGGRLEILMWARANGCPWDENKIVEGEDESKLKYNQMVIRCLGQPGEKG